MSTPVTYTWTDVINQLIDGVKAFLYQVGAQFAANAEAIAAAMIGIGIAMGLGYAVFRVVRPLVGRILRF